LASISGVVWPVFAQDAVSATVAALITIGASYYYQGMVATLVAREKRHEPSPGIWQMITGVPALKLIAIDLLWTALMVGGLALGILPGLVVLALTALVAPVTAVERPSIAAAFRRSATLVRPNFSPVFWIMVTIWLILVVLTGCAMLAAGALTGRAVWGHWAGGLGGNIVVAPIDGSETPGLDDAHKSRGAVPLSRKAALPGTSTTPSVANAGRARAPSAPKISPATDDLRARCPKHRHDRNRWRKRASPLGVNTPHRAA
jgi:hypothetical protein